MGKQEQTSKDPNIIKGLGSPVFFNVKEKANIRNPSSSSKNQSCSWSDSPDSAHTAQGFNPTCEKYKGRVTGHEQTSTNGNQETSSTANQNSIGREDTTKKYIHKFGIQLPTADKNVRKEMEETRKQLQEQTSTDGNQETSSTCNENSTVINLKNSFNRIIRSLGPDVILFSFIFGFGLFLFIFNAKLSQTFQYCFL